MFKKIGWDSITIVIVFIALLAFMLVKKANLKKHALYIKGVSLGINQGVRGNVNLDYYFMINGERYNGFVPGTFCKECKCCPAGDTVIVRFEDGNPKNNDLVLKVPEGATLEE